MKETVESSIQPSMF